MKNHDNLFEDSNGDPLDNPPRTKTKPARNTVQQANFVGFPLEWLEQVLPHVQGECQLAAAQLMFRQWVLQGRRRTFAFPSQDLKRLGIDRAVKAKMLARLEEAGLVSVKQQHGHAPRITQHWE